MGGQNIYFECRKQAAHRNGDLKSREKAADILGVSASSLSDYELGLTKRIPADVVDRMAALYEAPELRNRYCAECPLGQQRALETENKGTVKAAIRTVRELDEDAIKSLRKELIQIADGEKIEGTDEMMRGLRRIAKSISGMEIAHDRADAESTERAVRD